MGVRVKAVRLGYYDNKRRREGVVFEIAEKDLIYNDEGKLVSPKWVEVLKDAPLKARGRKKAELEVEAQDVSEQDVI